MTEHERTLGDLQREYAALGAEIERAEDRGVTVTPDKRQRLAGLYKLIKAREANEGGNDAGTNV